MLKERKYVFYGLVHNLLLRLFLTFYVNADRYSNLKHVSDLSASLFVTDIKKTQSANQSILMLERLMSLKYNSLLK